MYISSCLFSLISSGLLVTSWCILSLCPALSCLDVLIKYYYSSLYPRLRVPVPPSCVHRDRRPDLTVSGAHSPRFVFRFFLKSLFWFLFVSVPRQGSRRVRRESSGCEPSCPPIAGDIHRPRWLSQAHRLVA